MNKEIYIIRHGETDFNKRKIVQGSGVNSSLNDTGRAQAKALHEGYKSLDFELIFTSALVRTHETASHFIEDGLMHIEDADINEICWGIHEGKPGDAGMKEDYVRLNKAWKSGDYTARVEEGESAQELATRLQRFINILMQRPEKKIAVFTHGRTIRCLMCLVEERPIKYMDDYHHDNTGVYKVRQVGNTLEVLASNNIHHLNGLEIDGES